MADYNTISMSFDFFQWQDITNAISQEILQLLRQPHLTESMAEYKACLEQARQKINTTLCQITHQ